MNSIDVFLGPLVATAAAFCLGWILRGLHEERRRPWRPPSRFLADD